MPNLAQFFAQLGTWWSSMNGAQRVAFLSVLLMAAGAFGVLVHFAQQSEYSTLYSELAPEDASRIIDELNGMQVPFKLTQAGTSIQVPVERVYDVRLDLAAKGLPSAGPVGFEVFNDNSFGMTPFQQRIRLRRALEGELGRTITRLGPVRWARVHINLPEKTAFRRDKMHATASVVLGLIPGHNLDSSEGRGIAQLIAGAVNDLDAGHVSILDAKGQLLVRPNGDETDALAAEALGVKRSLEHDLERRAQALLDAAAGPGRSVVTVSADIDTRRIEEESDRVNPDEAAVVSEQRTEETRSQPNAIASGIPGAAANVPGGPEAQTGAAGESSEAITRETINFDVSRSRTRTVVPLGAVQRLSVAVLVDGTYTTPEAGAEGETAVPQYQPRSPEEIGQLTEIVKRAVGFNDQRGDVIEVQNFAFRSPLEDVVLEEPAFWERPELFLLVPSIARALAVTLGIALLVMFVLRPALRQLAGTAVPLTGRAAVGPGGAPASAEEVERLKFQQDAAEVAIPIAKEDAKAVADAMKQWLRE